MIADTEKTRKYISNSNHFRIDESELLCMRLGELVVSFEGYVYHDGLDITWNRLGPSRNKEEWYGAYLGLTEDCDFNSNDWFSPRYDFDGNGYYFDDSRGDYPFNPFRNYEDKYMLWEANAWKQQGFGTADNWWSAKAIMEESVWKRLTDPSNQLPYAFQGRKSDYTSPLEIIKAKGLTQSDLRLEKIYLYKEFDSKAELNEAHKAFQIKEYENKIEALKELPYGSFKE